MKKLLLIALALLPAGLWAGDPDEYVHERSHRHAEEQARQQMERQQRDAQQHRIKQQKLTTQMMVASNTKK